MRVFNQTAIDNISLAYDLFGKEEFLDRLFKFMIESEALIIENEQRYKIINEFCNKIIEGAKKKLVEEKKLDTFNNSGMSFTEGFEI